MRINTCNERDPEPVKQPRNRSKSVRLTLREIGSVFVELRGINYIKLHRGSRNPEKRPVLIGAFGLGGPAEDY
jgi:hypothetical protein